jgi:hypothetical protein
MRRRQATSVAPYQVDTQNLPAYPQEDSGTSAARLNWWLPEDERQKLASQAQHPGTLPPTPSTPQTPATDEPLDMFAEGRKRLEEEEQRRQSGGY